MTGNHSAIISQLQESAIRRGIRTVAIGKKGSKPLSSELVQEILAELRAGKVANVEKGAFFAALFLKGITPEERILEEALDVGILENPQKLTMALTAGAPSDIQDICRELLQGQELDQGAAYRLGQFLMSSQSGEGALGLAASALRVRYETPDEYTGLLEAIEETKEEPFLKIVPPGPPVIQLSEPFDGVEHSYMITPLVAKYLQTQDYRVIQMVGRNSGPKFGNNLWDVAMEMGGEFARGNTDLGKLAPDFGWFIDQADLAKALDRWVDIRRKIIKRPFLATLEKFVNPANARILVTSAFHPPYTEKMITVAERAGFPGAIVIRNGSEGTIAFALKRPVKIMCSARQADGNYLRHEFEYDPQSVMSEEIPVEEMVTRPSPQENARLIKRYGETGSSGNKFFDWRVKVTSAGLEPAIQWVESKIN